MGVAAGAGMIEVFERALGDNEVELLDQPDALGEFDRLERRFAVGEARQHLVMMDAALRQIDHRLEHQLHAALGERVLEGDDALGRLRHHLAEGVGERVGRHIGNVTAGEFLERVGERLGGVARRQIGDVERHRQLFHVQLRSGRIVQLEDRRDFSADIARRRAFGQRRELVVADLSGKAAAGIGAQAAADLAEERVDRALAGAGAQVVDALELDEVERRVVAQHLGLLQAGKHGFLEGIPIEQVVVAGGCLGEGRAQRRDREMNDAVHEGHAAARERDAGRFPVGPTHAQRDRLHAAAGPQALDRGGDWKRARGNRCR